MQVTEYAVEYLGAAGRAFAEELAFRKQMDTEQVIASLSPFILYM